MSRGNPAGAICSVENHSGGERFLKFPAATKVSEGDPVSAIWGVNGPEESEFDFCAGLLYICNMLMTRGIHGSIQTQRG